MTTCEKCQTLLCSGANAAAYRSAGERRVLTDLGGPGWCRRRPRWWHHTAGFLSPCTGEASAAQADVWIPNVSARTQSSWQRATRGTLCRTSVFWLSRRKRLITHVLTLQWGFNAVPEEFLHSLSNRELLSPAVKLSVEVGEVVHWSVNHITWAVRMNRCRKSKHTGTIENIHIHQLMSLTLTLISLGLFS